MIQIYIIDPSALTWCHQWSKLRQTRLSYSSYSCNGVFSTPCLFSVTVNHFLLTWKYSCWFCNFCEIWKNVFMKTKLVSLCCLLALFPLLVSSPCLLSSSPLPSLYCPSLIFRCTAPLSHTFAVSCLVEAADVFLRSVFTGRKRDISQPNTRKNLRAQKQITVETDGEFQWHPADLCLPAYSHSSLPTPPHTSTMTDTTQLCPSQTLTGRIFH